MSERPIFCDDATPVFFNLLDFSIAPALLYYAYIPTLILTIGFAVIALYGNNFSRNAKLFSGIAFSLAFFVIFTLFTWIAAPITLVMFSWQMWNLTLALMFFFTTLFAYSFVYDCRISPKLTIAMLLLLWPIILLLPTQLNVEGFDLSWCEGIAGSALLTYTYIYGLIAILAIIVIGVRAVWKTQLTKLTKKQTIVFTVSTALFLSLFYLSALYAELVGDFRYEIVGPLGAVVFLAGMAYVSVQYKRFDIKLIGTELLVIGLISVIGSIIFLNTLDHIRYVAGGSLILVLILGWLLTRSVRREIAQRKKIERLAEDLKKANKRLKILDKMKSEFVSIASHQLRSPLTAIRGYASMLLEGSYGKLPKKAQKAIERINDSSRFMALSVEDYLNVSRIEAGNMKYEKADFDLKAVAEKIVDEMRPAALKKGLLLTFRSDCDGSCSVHADIGKTRQIIMNLIDNAMKYTQKGSITVIAHDNVKKKKMYVSVKDTGVGMSKETLEEVFDKFIRAKNANEINVTGTGLGLFVAKKMAQEMDGDIWAESKGEGKGSIFHVELPLLPGKRRN